MGQYWPRTTTTPSDQTPDPSAPEPPLATAANSSPAEHPVTETDPALVLLHRIMADRDSDGAARANASPLDHPPPRPAGASDNGSDDEAELPNPLGTPDAAWRPRPNAEPIRWRSPKGTKCWKEAKTVAYKRRGDADDADCSEERQLIFVMGDAVFVQHINIDRARHAEIIVCKLLDARQQNVFFATSEVSVGAGGNAEFVEAAKFTQGTAMAAGTVLRVFAQMEGVTVDDILAQLPGAYGYKDLLRAAAGDSAGAVGDVTSQLLMALARDKLRAEGAN